MLDEFEIIDMHVHTYPNSKIGLQAMQGTGVSGMTGTIEELLQNMKDNISKAIQVNMTPVREMADAALKKLPKNLTPAEMEEEEKKILEKMKGRNIRRNDWTCEMADKYEKLIAYVSLDPLCGSAMVTELLDKVKNRNVLGIKLHPGNGRFFPNDKSMWSVYEKAVELKLPIITHSGGFMTPDNVQYAQPKHFMEVLETFPNLILVLAHLGLGFYEETRTLAKKFDNNLYFDCSRAVTSGKMWGTLKDDQAIELIREIGVERVMWGSDYPWCNPTKDALKLASMNFTNEEKIMLFAENAKNILKI
ncbi:MAG: amidohydrolase family protein [Candidatus Helarchaeota archaeon]|nr:amidohydrolase family protein [Candidatus Helarchaeota archaeon]